MTTFYQGRNFRVAVIFQNDGIPRNRAFNHPVVQRVRIEDEPTPTLPNHLDFFIVFCHPRVVVPRSVHLVIIIVEGIVGTLGHCSGSTSAGIDIMHEDERFQTPTATIMMPIS